MSNDEEHFAVVVIGSGFGGSVAALTFLNLLREVNKRKPEGEEPEQVCVLERGQWWLSHEIPVSRNPPTPNLREFLLSKGQPFGTWAHPDNVKGLTRLFSMSRQVHPRGLYDLRSIHPEGKVNVVCASGVGGGSLVYANVTASPEPTIWEHWPTEGVGRGLVDYFAPAEEFIGTNKITTIAGLTGQKLHRSKMFNEAVQEFQKAAAAGETEGFTVLNKMTEKGGVTQVDTELPLSITDVPAGLFGKPGPSRAQVEKYRSPIQQNVCQRQARCVLGCLPGARHTLNKRLFLALQEEGASQEARGKRATLVVKALCEATGITYDPTEEYPYGIAFVQRFEAKPPVVGVLRAKRLVVAAGTLGTTELLLKSKGGLQLSKQLGEGFSSDGDLLGYIVMNGKTVDNTRGPINTSHLLVGKDATPKPRFVCSIEDTAIAPMVANAFATFLELDNEASRKEKFGVRLGFRRKARLLFRYPLLGLSMLVFRTTLRRIQKIVKRLLDDKTIRAIFETVVGKAPETGADLRDPETGDTWAQRRMHRFLNGMFTDRDDPFASPAKRLERFFLFSCMGIDSAKGRLELTSDWDKTQERERRPGERPGEKLRLTWKPEMDAASFTETIQAVRQLASKIDSKATVRTPTWNESDRGEKSLYVLHPLGGCRMGSDVSKGVVNGFGQVFMRDGQGSSNVYPDFYLMDGSVIPTPLGINSSLTITAVALRCIEKAIEDELVRRPGLPRRPAREYWPVGWKSAVVSAKDEAPISEVSVTPLPPFPDTATRVLPVLWKSPGTYTVRRSDFPTGVVLVWKPTPESTVPADLLIREFDGPQTRVGPDDHPDSPGGIVLWPPT